MILREITKFTDPAVYCTVFKKRECYLFHYVE